jgi:hypothetical protein
VAFLSLHLHSTGRELAAAAADDKDQASLHYAGPVQLSWFWSKVKDLWPEGYSDQADSYGNKEAISTYNRSN